MSDKGALTLDQIKAMGSYVNDPNNPNGRQGSYLSRGAILGFEPLAGVGRLDRYTRSAVRGIDMQDLAYDMQSGGELALYGLGRLLGTTITKTLQGFAGLAGAPAALITGNMDAITDNFMVNAIEGLEENIKESMPINKSKKYTQGNVFKQMLTPEFWMDDGIDGLAFLLSALIPGVGVSKLGTGGKVLSGISKNFAKTLSKIAAGEDLTKLGTKAVNLKRIAQGIDIASGSAIMSGFEAGFEARESQKQMIEGLINKGYSEKEAREISAPYARNVYLSNMAALSLSNAFELGMLVKAFKPGKTALDIANKNAQAIAKEAAEKVAGNAAKAGSKALDITKNVGTFAWKGIATSLSEGAWEENIQLAISDYERDKALGKEERGRIHGLLGNWLNNFTTDEGQKNIMLGAILGLIPGGIGGVRSRKQEKANIASLERLIAGKNDIYKGGLRDFYVKTLDENGKEKIVLDEKGNPQIDIPALANRFFNEMETAELTKGEIAALLTNDRPAFNAIRLVKLARWAYDYFGEEGGREFLEQQLERKAADEHKDVGANVVIDMDENGKPITLQDNIDTMKNKLRVLEDIYNQVENSMLAYGQGTTREARQAIEQAKALRYDTLAKIEAIKEGIAAYENEKSKLDAQLAEMDNVEGIDKTKDERYIKSQKLAKDINHLNKLKEDALKALNEAFSKTIVDDITEIKVENKKKAEQEANKLKYNNLRSELSKKDVDFNKLRNKYPEQEFQDIINKAEEDKLQRDKKDAEDREDDNADTGDDVNDGNDDTNTGNDDRNTGKDKGKGDKNKDEKGDDQQTARKENEKIKSRFEPVLKELGFTLDDIDGSNYNDEQANKILDKALEITGSDIKTDVGLNEAIRGLRNNIKDDTQFKKFLGILLHKLGYNYNIKEDDGTNENDLDRFEHEDPVYADGSVVLYISNEDLYTKLESGDLLVNKENVDKVRALLSTKVGVGTKLILRIDKDAPEATTDNKDLYPIGVYLEDGTQIGHIQTYTYLEEEIDLTNTLITEARKDYNNFQQLYVRTLAFLKSDNESIFDYGDFIENSFIGKVKNLKDKINGDNAQEEIYRLARHIKYIFEKDKPKSEAELIGSLEIWLSKIESDLSENERIRSEFDKAIKDGMNIDDILMPGEVKGKSRGSFVKTGSLRNIFDVFDKDKGEFAIVKLGTAASGATSLISLKSGQVVHFNKNKIPYSRYRLYWVTKDTPNGESVAIPLNMDMINKEEIETISNGIYSIIDLFNTHYLTNTSKMSPNTVELKEIIKSISDIIYVNKADRKDDDFISFKVNTNVRKDGKIDIVQFTTGYGENTKTIDIVYDPTTVKESGKGEVSIYVKGKNDAKATRYGYEKGEKVIKNLLKDKPKNINFYNYKSNGKFNHLALNKDANNMSDRLFVDIGRVKSGKETISIFQTGGVRPMVISLSGSNVISTNKPKDKKDEKQEEVQQAEGREEVKDEVNKAGSEEVKTETEPVKDKSEPTSDTNKESISKIYNTLVFTAAIGGFKVKKSTHSYEIGRDLRTLIKPNVEEGTISVFKDGDIYHMALSIEDNVRGAGMGYIGVSIKVDKESGLNEDIINDILFRNLEHVKNQEFVNQQKDDAISINTVNLLDFETIYNEVFKDKSEPVEEKDIPESIDNTNVESEEDIIRSKLQKNVDDLINKDFVESRLESKLDGDSYSDDSTKRAVKLMANTLTKRFNLDIKFIDNPLIKTKATYSKTGLLINLHYAKITDVIHEFSHPLVGAIRVSNKSVYDGLLEEIANTALGQVIIDEVNNLYPDYNDDLKSDEVVVRFISRHNARELDNRSLLKRIADTIIYYMNLVLNKVFGHRIKFNIDENTTIYQLSKYLISNGFYEIDGTQLTNYHNTIRYVESRLDDILKDSISEHINSIEEEEEAINLLTVLTVNLSDSQETLSLSDLRKNRKAEQEGKPIYSIKDQVKNVIKGRSPHVNEKQRDLLNRIVRNLEEVTPDKEGYSNSLWVKAKNNLAGIFDISINDVDEINYLEENNQLTKNWDDSGIAQVKPSDKTLAVVKAAIVKLPNMEDGTIRDEKGKLLGFDTLTGFPKYLDFKETLAYLRRFLTNSVDINDMKSILRTIASFNRTIARATTLIEEDSSLLSAFFSELSQQFSNSAYIHVTPSTNNYSLRDSFIKPWYVLANKYKNNINNLLSTLTPKEVVLFANNVNKTAIDLNNDLLSNIYIAPFEDNRVKTLDTISKRVSSLLNEIGIDIDPETIRMSAANAKSVSPILFIQDTYVKSAMKILEDLATEYKLTYTTMVNEIAKAAADFSMEGIENSFLTVDGKLEYVVRPANYLTDWFKLANSQDRQINAEFKNYIKEIASISEFKYSNWLFDEKGNIDYDVFSEMTYHILDGIKNSDTGIGVRFKDMEPLDWNRVALFSYLDTVKKSKGKEVVVPISVLSDSSQSYLIRLKRVTLGSKDVGATGRKHEGGYLVLKRESKLYNKVVNTVKQEVSRMLQARDYLFDYEDGKYIPKDTSDMVLKEYYHYNGTNEDGSPKLIDENGYPTGNVFKFHNIESINDIKGIFYKGIVLNLFTNNQTNKDLWDKIYSEIDKFAVNLTRDLANQYKDIYQEVKDDHKAEIGNAAYRSEFGLEQIMMEYGLNQYLFNVESQLYWGGVTAEYKNGEDYVKRIKELVSPGNRLSGIHLGETYQALVINDVELESSAYGLMESSLKRIFKDEVDQSYIDAILSDYKEITTGDGFAIVSQDRYIRILKDLGRDKPFKHMIEEYQKAGITKYRFKKGLAYDDIAEVVNGMKPFYYDRRFDSELGLMTSVQNKYFIFPTLREFTEGTELQDIADYMDNNDIGEMLFKSGFKVGVTHLNTIDVNGKLDMDALKASKPVTLFNSSWRYQQTVPYHVEDTTIKAGVQPFKLMLSNIANDTLYNFVNKEEGITGKDLFDHYNNLIISLINKAEDNIRFKFKDGYESVSKILVEESNKREFSNGEKYIVSIDPETGKFNMPIFFSTYVDRMTHVLTSIFTNSITNLKVPGMHTMLHANVFAESKIEGGTGRKLKSYYNDKLKTWVYQAYIPAYDSRFYDKDGKLISIDKLSDEAKLLFGYRIPYSSKHSSAVLEIVGFVPKIAGATVVLPDDVVARMNSDFDGDSLYINVPVVYNKDGRFELVPYSESLEESEIQNRYANFINESIRDREERDEIKEEIYSKSKADSQIKYLEVKDESKAKSRPIKKLSKEQREKVNSLFEESVAFKSLPKFYQRLFKDQESLLSDVTGSEKILWYQNFAINLLSHLTKEEIAEDLIANGFEGNVDTMAERYSNEVPAIIKSMLDEYDKVINEIVIDEQYQQDIKDIWSNLLEDHKIRLNEEIWNKFRFTVAETLAIKNDLISYNDFKQLPIEDQNSKAAIYNRILGTFISILSNDANLDEAFRPAAFNDTEEIAKAINELRREYISNVNPVLPQHQLYLRTITHNGKKMIGITANSNPAVAVFQAIKAKFGEDISITIKYKKDSLPKPISWFIDAYGENNVIENDNDIEVTSNMIGWNMAGTGFRDHTDKLITERNGQWVDHSADAIKKPLPFNFNPFTYTAYLGIALPTSNIEYASWLIHQPIIERVFHRYSENNNVVGMIARDEVYRTETAFQIELYKMLRQIGKANDEKVNDKIDKGKTKDVFNEDNIKLLGYDVDAPALFTQEDLEEMIRFRNSKDFGRHKAKATDKIIKYYQDQLKVLELYKHATFLGDIIQKNIKITNADKLGAGPTLDVTTDFEASLVEAATNNLMISDLTNLSVAETIYPKIVFDRSLKEGLLLVDSKYPLLEQYYISSNRLSYETIREYLINVGPSFRNIKDRVLASTASISKSQREIVDKAVDRYLMAMFIEENPNFQIDPKEKKRILGIDQEIVNIEDIDDSNYYDLSTAMQLFYIQRKGNIDKNDRHVINYIRTNLFSDDATKYNMHTLDFNSAYKEYNLDNKLQISFLKMYYSEDPKLRALAHNLIMYSFLTTGLASRFGSFNRAIDPRIYKEEFGLDKTLYDIQDRELNNLDESIVNGYNRVADMVVRANKRLIPIVKTLRYVDEEGNQKEVIKGTPDWYKSLDSKTGLIEIESNNDTTGWLRRNIKDSEYIILRNADIGDKTIDEQIFRREVRQIGTSEYWFYYPVPSLGNAKFMEVGEVSIINENPIHTPEQYNKMIDDRVLELASQASKKDKVTDKVVNSNQTNKVKPIVEDAPATESVIKEESVEKKDATEQAIDTKEVKKPKVTQTKLEFKDTAPEASNVKPITDIEREVIRNYAEDSNQIEVKVRGRYYVMEGDITKTIIKNRSGKEYNKSDFSGSELTELITRTVFYRLLNRDITDTDFIEDNGRRIMYIPLLEKRFAKVDESFNAIELTPSVSNEYLSHLAGSKVEANPEERYYKYLSIINDIKCK